MLWFKKTPKSARQDDKVFMDDKSKYKAIEERLKPEISKLSPLMVVYYFEETKEKIIKLLEEKSIKYRKIENEFVGDLSLPADGEIFLIKAKTLYKVFNLRQANQKTEKMVCSFLFAEHYPLFTKEEAILNKIDILTGFNAVIGFYVSLDEPLLSVFGSDKIKIMMQRMGLQENECIEHTFVTKSITNAQKKIEKKIPNDSDAVSQEAWFAKYYPKDQGN